MTRLRLAPSSPDRMAELTRQLYQRHAAGSYYTGVSEHPKPETAIGWVHAATRAARLLLRWYSQGHVLYQRAHEQILEHGRPSLSDYYGTAWRSTYTDRLWPADGDERLRRELNEKENRRC